MNYEEFENKVIAEIEKLETYKGLNMSLEDYLKRQHAEDYIKHEFKTIGELPWVTPTGAIDAAVSNIEMD